MSAIQSSLQNLDEMIAKLEGSVTTLEGNTVGRQPDMFASATVGASNQNNTSSFDKTEVKQRLDQAIHAVETLIAEEGA